MDCCTAGREGLEGPVGIEWPVCVRWCGWSGGTWYNYQVGKWGLEGGNGVGGCSGPVGPCTAAVTAASDPGRKFTFTCPSRLTHGGSHNWEWRKGLGPVVGAPCWVCWTPRGCLGLGADDGLDTVRGGPYTSLGLLCVPPRVGGLCLVALGQSNRGFSALEQQ